MRRMPRASPRAVVLTAMAGVAAGVLLVVLFVNLASREEGLQLGDEVFVAGRADQLARTIDRGGPVLYPDPLKRSAGRNLYVQHLGDEPTAGWLAFQAHFDDPSCQLRWDDDGEHFTDPCTGQQVPASGTGLPQFPVTVTDGDVVVDLREG